MNAAPVAKFLALAALLSGALHLVWENAQAPLFAGYQNFWQHFWICLWAIPGDVGITLLLYGLLAWWRRDIAWALRVRRPRVALAALVGAAMAVAAESYALAIGRWSYAPAMPLIPYLAVGLTPVLQMAILPSLVFSLSGWLLRSTVRSVPDS